MLGLGIALLGVHQGQRLYMVLAVGLLVEVHCHMPMEGLLLKVTNKESMA